MEPKLLVIRKMEDYDIPFVKKLEEDLNLSPWSIESYREYLNNIDSINFVATVNLDLNQKIVGFIIARLIMHGAFINEEFKPKNEIEIYNIAVDTDYRRQGIGRQLLKECETQINQGEVLQIWLEVRGSNLAGIKFYTNLGFKEIYRRKSFYVNPIEDALVMCLEK